MIANNSAFANQAATEAKQAAMMAKSLDNLANATIQKNDTVEKLVTANKNSQRPSPMPTPPLHDSVSQILRILCQLHQQVQQIFVAHPTGQPSSQTGTLPATVQRMALKLNVGTPAPPAPTHKRGTTLQPPNLIPRAAVRPTKGGLRTPDGLNQQTC
jgi:hypothetical protein